MSRILMEKRTDSLSVALTESKWIERVRERSAVEDDIDAKLSELARLKSEHALAREKLEAQIKDIQGRERTLASAVRTRTEIGPVEVEAYADLGEEKMITIRLDTGEEIYRRPLTEVETRRARQRDLDFGTVEWGKAPPAPPPPNAVPEPGPTKVSHGFNGDLKPVKVAMGRVNAKGEKEDDTKGFDWQAPRPPERDKRLGDAGRSDALPEAADTKAKPKRGPKVGTKAAVEAALEGARE